MTGDAAVAVRDLRKVFRTYKKRPGFGGAVRDLWDRRHDDTVAVRDVSLTVAPGEFVGFLGPNGAGKTTTLKMLSGLMHPTSGTARVLGFVPWERRRDFQRRFSLVMGQKNQLWWDLPASESLELNRVIYGIEAKVAAERIGSFTEWLGVADKLNVQVRELSLGERMKFELIAALLHQPEVLFLDEPTIGLDVVSQRRIREFLRDFNVTRKTTILLTSHYMQDIEALCPRVIVIDRGTVRYDGPLRQVVDRFADHKIVAWVSEAMESAGTEQVAALGEVLEREGPRVRLRVKRDRIAEVCKALLSQWPVQDLTIEDVPVEDVIRELFERGVG